MVKKINWTLYGLAFLLICGFVVIVLLNNSPVNAVEPAQDPIMIVLDGTELEFDVPPTMINNRIMVPMRVIFEALGAEIKWDEKTKTVTATKDDLIVKTTIGQTKIYVNGVAKEMDVAPVIVNNRTLVPVRFVSEALGCYVEWSEKGKTVYIHPPYNGDYAAEE